MFVATSLEGCSGGKVKNVDPENMAGITFYYAGKSRSDRQFRHINALSFAFVLFSKFV